MRTHEPLPLRAPLLLISAGVLATGLHAQRPGSVLPLTATVATAPAAVDLHWQPGSQDERYRVYFRGTDGPWQLATELSGNANGISDPGVLRGETWQYMVANAERFPREQAVCIPVGTQLTFSIQDSWGDGLCCDHGDGWWRIDACGTTVAQGSAPGGTQQHSFSVCGTSGCSSVNVVIAPDIFVDPVQWTLRASDGTLWASGGPYPTPRFSTIEVAVDAPVPDHNGGALLIVEETIHNALAPEVERLVQDMRNEGWRTQLRVCMAQQTPPEIKDMVLQARSMDPELRTVLLLGPVPVPYSGAFAPDGHVPDHQGAWPADLYYGELDGPWTDTEVDVSAGIASSRNRNRPGDGKFDQSVLPSDVDLAVGRVDLGNLPALGSTGIEQVRAYLDRNHAFRNGRTLTERRAVVHDNITEYDFSSVVYRAGIAMFGADGVQPGHFVNAQLQAAPLLMMAAGGGTYTSADGITSTPELAGVDLRGVFVHMFGSYFGEWSTPDNLLRAVVAQGMLGAVWGDEALHLQHLGTNGTFGEAVRRSQNASYANHGKVGRGVHVALMGDPTLRLFPIAPVDALNALALHDQVELSWPAHALADRGYAIYRALNADDRMERIATAAAGTTNIMVPHSGAVETWYAIRPIHTDTTASGIFQVMGPMTRVLQRGGMGQVTVFEEDAPRVHPQPSTGCFTIAFPERPDHWQLLDLHGRPVRATTELHANTLELRTDAPSGSYLLRYGTSGSSRHLRLSIVR